VCANYTHMCAQTTHIRVRELHTNVCANYTEMFHTCVCIHIVCNIQMCILHTYMTHVCETCVRTCIVCEHVHM